MPSASAAVRFLCVATLLAIFAATPSRGAEKRWKNAAGGSWHAATNWENNSPPGAADAARFLWSPSGVVYFEANAATDNLRLGGPSSGATVALDLNGNTYTTRWGYLAYDVNRSGYLTVRDGRLRVTEWFGSDMQSRLTLEAGGIFEVESYRCGLGGTGGFRSTTRILNGGTLKANEFDASNSGFSTVEVLDGGKLETQSAVLGSWYPSNPPDEIPGSTILVSGQGSLWENSGSVEIVGNEGSAVDLARLTVEEFGRVYNAGDLSTTSEGQIHLKESGRIETNSLSCANGTLTFTGGTLVVRGDDPAPEQTHPGKFSIGSPTLDLGGPDEPTLAFGNGAYDAELSTINVGTPAGPARFHLNGGSTLTTTDATIGVGGDGRLWLGDGSEWTNSGRVEIGFGDSAGELIINSNCTFRTGSLVVADPSNVDVNGGGRLEAVSIDGPFHLNSGRLKVQNVLASLVQYMTSTLEVGDSLGRTTIADDYQLKRGSSIEFELAGTSRGVDYDCIDVGGAFTIDSGLLRVALANDFVPQPGDAFDLFDADPVSGSFTYLFFPTLPDGGVWLTGDLYSAGVIRVNRPPTATALTPATVECDHDGTHVELSTTVDDGDDQPLTVEWYVDDVLVQTDADVAPGSSVEFAFDYSHGAHVVTVRIDDGHQTVETGTTVTAADTTAPMVIVAADVVVATDPGESFATGVVLTPPTVGDLCDGEPVVTNDAPAAFPIGETVVVWTATDADGNVGSGTQKVIVEDREAPAFGDLRAERTFCDEGKTFARLRLPRPDVFDNAPGEVVVESDAPRRFPIGKTFVKWTATDGAGNVSKKTQTVVVVNRKPKAKAGRNVVVTTTSERGARVSLDGSSSSDPDMHKLKFAWKAKRTKLAKGKTAQPSGLFKVGKTTATLTVTDAGKAKDTDTVTVTVKLKNGKHRPRGADANEAFAIAARAAETSVAEGVAGEAAAAGLVYASMAAHYGDAAGEFVRWEEGQSEAHASLSYAELRVVQQQYGAAAAEALLAAYAETADESLLTAYSYAAYGAAAAQADLMEP